MSASDGILALEAQRRAAMLGGDVQALRQLLAPELAYVHSTGVSDTRDSLLAKLDARQIAYAQLHFERLVVTVSEAADAALVTGEMRAQVRRDGESRGIAARYLAVWLKREGAWQLSAFQGTTSPAA